MTSRPALAQPHDQLGDQGGVLGRALHQRQRVLRAVDVDPQSDHAGVLAEVHPVDHERHQIQLRQIRGQQLRPARSRSGRRTAATPPSWRWRSRPARCAPRPAPARPRSGGSRARRASGPAPSAQDLGVGEQLVGGHGQLAGAVGRAHPRPGHRDPAPAQAHRPGAVAVAGRGPLRVVAALGPARRGHVRFHDRRHHLQPGPDREGQQALAHLTGQLGQRHAHRVRHGGLARVDLLVLVVLAHGGPLPRGVLGGSPEYLPHGRTQVGDRHLKFHESRDNLRGHHDASIAQYPGTSVDDRSAIWSTVMPVNSINPTASFTPSGTPAIWSSGTRSTPRPERQWPLRLKQSDGMSHDTSPQAVALG